MTLPAHDEHEPLLCVLLLDSRGVVLAAHIGEQVEQLSGMRKFGRPGSDFFGQCDQAVTEGRTWATIVRGALREVHQTTRNGATANFDWGYGTGLSRMKAVAARVSGAVTWYVLTISPRCD